MGATSRRGSDIVTAVVRAPDVRLTRPVAPERSAAAAAASTARGAAGRAGRLARAVAAGPAAAGRATARGPLRPRAPPLGRRWLRGRPAGPRATLPARAAA